MKTDPDFEFVGPTLYIPKFKTLVIGDLHIGTEYSLAETGALSSIIGLSEIREITVEILQKKKVEKIILIGDLEVHFGHLQNNQKNAILDYLKLIKEYTKEIILIEGNHDKIISKIVGEMGLKFQNTYQLKEYFFSHGDKIQKEKKGTKYIIIGHEHPAVGISDNIRTEKFKCFLVSKYNESTLIVLPSLNQTFIGTEVNKNKLLSPYLKENILKNARVYIIENMKVYNFGKLKELKRF